MDIRGPFWIWREDWWLEDNCALHLEVEWFCENFWLSREGLEWRVRTPVR